MINTIPVWNPPAAMPAVTPAPVPAAPVVTAAAAPAAPAISDEAQAAFDKNKAYLAQGDHTYNTDLAPTEEAEFQKWVAQNNVPFDTKAPVTDYDMRGFWKALKSGDKRATSAVDPNDKKLHYPDFWKTPYHETFSNESQWADPKKAPHWTDDDKLVAPDGTVLFDDRAKKKK